MTVFCKIKDEFGINSKELFELEIRKVSEALQIAPRSIKVNFDTKSAFLTMNSTKDSEEFVRRFNTHANNPSLYFNVYKPKQERIKTSQYLQKAGLNNKIYKSYNQFGNNQPGNNQNMQENIAYQQQSRYKKYNDNENEMGMMNNQGQGRFNNYNNLDNNFQMSQMNNNMKMNNNAMMMNNNFMNPNMQQMQMSQGNDDEENEEDKLAGMIYDYVVQINEHQAGKITGMIKGTGVDQMKELLRNPSELRSVILQASKMITSK